MAAYKLIENGVFTNRIVIDDPALAPGWTLVLDDGTGAIGDLWDGHVFSKPPAPPPRVPAFVTKRQGMAELIDRDLLATVQGILDGIAGKPGNLARNDFANSQEWQRNWPLIAQLQPVLGWSDAFVDDLFISAKAR